MFYVLAVLGGIVLAVLALIVWLVRTDALHQTVYQSQRGLLYRDGVFQRILEPGRHRYDPRHNLIKIVSVRVKLLKVGRQRIVTTDQVPAELYLGITYQVVDPFLAISATDRFDRQLKHGARVAAERVGGTSSLHQLLHDQPGVADQMTPLIQEVAERLGLNVLAVDLQVDLDDSLWDALDDKAAQIHGPAPAPAPVQAPAPVPGRSQSPVQDGDIELAIDPARDLRTPPAEPAPLPDAVFNG